MEIRPIRTDEDLAHAFERFQALWGAKPGTPDGDEFDVLATLIEAYEQQHHALPPGNPIEVINFKMGELGLSGRELARRLGWGSGRVSEVLSGKRSLTLAMVQQLAAVLGIAPGLLVGREGAEASGDGWVWLRPQVLQKVRSAISAESDESVAAWIERAAMQALAMKHRTNTPATFISSTVARRETDYTDEAGPYELDIFRTTQTIATTYATEDAA